MAMCKSRVRLCLTADQSLAPFLQSQPNVLAAFRAVQTSSTGTFPAFPFLFEKKCIGHFKRKTVTFWAKGTEYPLHLHSKLIVTGKKELLQLGSQLNR